ncbi:hypothetical protein ACPW7J_07370 [Ihubacter sp. rT4E-8]|uniref:hypothetical protein n=1 Tax=Ihubacter sp. rT4E-8 TaxID=3242369 RepID=UPI00137A88FA
MLKMKKLLISALAIAMVLSFAACGGGDDNGGGEGGDANAAGAKTGYAVVSSIADVEDKTLTIDSVVAAALVDADGKIISLKVDEMQIKPDLGTDDGTVSDLRSKLDKKEDYNMKGASPIGKEWYEQIAALEEWAKGKTADEVKAAIGEDGYPTDEDLTAGCTIYLTDIVKAVTAAIDNAQDLGASADDTLKLAVTAEKSYQSSDENLQYDAAYAAVTVDADGKITSCLIDASQAKCALDGGKFKVEAGSYATKKELKEDYNMKGASPIEKEWYEQAEAYEAWAKGKTVDEIKGAVDGEGYPSDEDLKAGCTIVVSAIVSAIEAAMAH